MSLKIPVYLFDCVELRNIITYIVDPHILPFIEPRSIISSSYTVTKKVAALNKVHVSGVNAVAKDKRETLRICIKSSGFHGMKWKNSRHVLVE